jgi:uncharacterized membrane protein
MTKCLLLIAVVAIWGAALAQSPVVLKDTGLKKLAVFVGTWKAENESHKIR